VKNFYVRDLSDEEKIHLYKKIRKNTNKYVLKPMKERRGNNYFNEDIVKLLPDEESNVKSLIET
jgi:hypothetical protein